METMLNLGSKKSPPIKAGLGAATLALLTGCASIVNGGPGTVFIATEPAGATFTISRAGSTITAMTGTTPSEATLAKKRGYFSGQEYILVVEKPGYQREEMRIKPTTSGWYYGNILFGGLIGLLAVDPATGAMWNLSPDNINLVLTPAEVAPAGLGPVTEPPITDQSLVPPAPVTAPAVVSTSSGALGTGQQRLARNGLSLRARPASDGAVINVFLTDTAVTLLGEAYNSEGNWWYVSAENGKGWLRSTEFGTP